LLLFPISDTRLFFNEGDHRRRQLRRTLTPFSLTSIRAGLRLMMVILAAHFVSSPLPTDGRTMNLQLPSNLRIRDASFREDLNLYPVIETQVSVCRQNAPPVA